MSDARHGRFEIDLDDIERQLRRAAEPPSPAAPADSAFRLDAPPKSEPAPRGDPLAELARIVGQDDPFRGLFRDEAPVQSRAGDASPVAPAPSLRPTIDPRDDRSAPAAADFAPEMEAVLHGTPAALRAGHENEDLFDPTVDAYGSFEGALDEDRFEPLPPPRSRKGLIIAGTLVVAAVLGTAGWLAWRDSGTTLASRSGAPPVVRADTAPLKVAPENPGGMEIPDQNKQIYERGAQDGQTRVVDRQEQPIDVREAARALPPVPGASAPGQNARPGRPNAVSTVLGEPRRVRTVSVRPDGTLTNTPPSVTPDPVPMLSPGSVPPPVPVATIPITTNGAAARTPAAAAPAIAATATPAAAPPSGPAPVTVLPPRRPKLETRSELSPPDGEVAPLPTGPRAPQRMASAAPEEDEPVTTNAVAGRYAVQLGIRGSEQEARTAFSQFAKKYPELGDRSPAIARAEVAGKTIYRVRVGNLSRQDADTLCTSLKASGAPCFVTQN